MSQTPKIVILGFGSLMESLLPCCGALLGSSDPAVWSEQLYAVKGSPEGLEEKQKQYPFPVSAGDSPTVLRRVRPDVILFSPPPTLAKTLTETVLLPYYNELRKAGASLPLLITFPPTPLPRYYRQTLGKGAAQATILPCVVQKAGTYTVGHLGYSLAAMDGRSIPDPEQMKMLMTFTQPVGTLLHPSQDDLIAALTGMVTAHNVYELAFTLERGFDLCGQPVPFPQIAAAMRRELRRFAPELVPADAPDVPVCTGELPPPFEALTGLTVRAWYEGLCQFAAGKKLDLLEYGKFLRATMDVLLMTVQTETRERLHQLSDGCATKGGLLERALISYHNKVEHPLSRHICEEVAKNQRDSISDPEAVPDWVLSLVTLAEEIAGDVFERGSHLE